MNITPRAGDIIACSGASFSSDLINVLTYGVPRVHFSHLMIAGGDDLVYESNDESELPCIITGKHTKGTQAHFADTRLSTYRGKVWIYRLVRPLNKVEAGNLRAYLRSTIGRQYDTLGATRSGGKIWSLIQSRLHREALESLFCSEWVAAALKEIHRFDTKSASQWSPNSFIREANRRAILLPPVRVK